MSKNHPPSDQVPSYQGRPLAKPHEELVDQGLGFDVTTPLLDVLRRHHQRELPARRPDRRR